MADFIGRLIIFGLSLSVCSLWGFVIYLSILVESFCFIGNQKLLNIVYIDICWLLNICICMWEEYLYVGELNFLDFVIQESYMYFCMYFFQYLFVFFIVLLWCCRFLRYVFVVYVDYFGQILLIQIYGIFNRVMFRLVFSLKFYVEFLINVMVEFYLMLQVIINKGIIRFLVKF